MRNRIPSTLLGCLMLATVGTHLGAQESEKEGSSLAAVVQEQRQSLAQVVVQQREAASGMEWDASFREAFVKRLVSLPTEAFEAYQSAGADGVVSPLLGSSTVDQVYTPVTPCRFVNGINAADRVTAPANGTTPRYYRVRGSTASDFTSQGASATAPTGCGIPTSATAVVLNVTVADPTADGDLRVDPSHLPPSSTSVLNYTFGGARGRNLANGVIANLCDLSVSSCSSGATPTSPTRDLLITFHAGATDSGTYFLADVLGYFAPATGFAPIGCPSTSVFAELAAAQCPAAAGFGQPECSLVPVGALCEYDSGCSTAGIQVLKSDGTGSTPLSNSLNNCAGSTDWYIRLQ